MIISCAQNSATAIVELLVYRSTSYTP